MSRACKKLASSKILMVLAVLALFAVYFLRIINLDQDLPSWGVAEYQPKDEGCYAIMAVNEWEYGVFNPSDYEDTGIDFPMYIQEHTRINLLGNLMGVAGFHLLGDNYYGLRMPMVVLGFANLLLMFLVLLEIRKQYGKHTPSEIWGIIGILLLMSQHFYFYISSRTVEPSTLRMFFAQLSMLIWLKSARKGKLCFFLLGVCITVSVFLVYITNVFLYLAVGLLLLVIWKTEGFKPFFQNTCAFAVGSLLLFAVAEVYYFTVWDTFAIENLLASIGVFSGVAGYEITSGGIKSIIWGLLRGAIRFFSSNFFLYSPGLLFALLLIVPVAIWSIVRKKDKTLFLMVAIPAAFLVQTMVSEDYIWRKFLVVCPYVTFLIYWGILNWNVIAQLIGNYQKWCATGNNRFFCFVRRMILPGFVALCAFASAFVVLYRIRLVGDAGKLDFTSFDKLLLLILGCLPILGWAAYAIYANVRSKHFPMTKMILAIGGSSLLLGLGLLYVNVWHDPSFEERDMMISLSEKYDLDGKYVIGDFVMGITLYNDLKPVMDSHQNYGYRMADHPDMLLFHYGIDSVGMREYFDNELFDSLSPYAASYVTTVPGTLQVNGWVRDFALYECKPRNEVVKEEQERYRNEIRFVQEDLDRLSQNNDQLTYAELNEKSNQLQWRLESIYEYYPDAYGNRNSTILSPIYVDTYGDILGDVYAPVYGNIYGDVYGDIKAEIYGNIYGDIFGDICVPIHGEHYGEVYGETCY